MAKLKDWWEAATKDERDSFIRQTGVSEGYMKTQLIYGHRHPYPELAQAMEVATREINYRNRGRTPILWREDLCPACSACTLVKEKKGGS